MADIEQTAGAEATAKGLSGQARKSYIGGVFNRIRQAHDRAIRPGMRGLKLLNRRNRQLARARYKEALAPHEQAVADLKRQRKQELEQLSYEKADKGESSTQLTQRILHSDLKPVRHVEGLNIGAEMAAGPNPTHLRDIYGQEQLPKALDLFPTPSLRKAARERGMPAGGSRHDVIARLAQPAAPAKPPKLPAPERQRQRAIADAIKHGAPDFPPGTLAAAQGKPAAKPAKPAAKLRPAGSRPRKPLVPIKQLPGFQLDATRKLDPYFIREYFGAHQLPTALEVQTPKNLAEAVSVVEQKTGKRYDGSKKDRAEMYHWILANMSQQKGGGAIQHGAPDFPPGTLAAAQGKAATPPPPAAPAARARPAEKGKKPPPLTYEAYTRRIAEIKAQNIEPERKLQQLIALRGSYRRHATRERKEH